MCARDVERGRPVWNAQLAEAEHSAANLISGAKGRRFKSSLPDQPQQSLKPLHWGGFGVSDPDPPVLPAVLGIPSLLSYVAPVRMAVYR